MNHTIRTMLTLSITGALGFACASSERATPDTAGQSSVAAQVSQTNACNDWEIYFATGASEVSPETRTVLERLARCIRSGDVREVVVVGSTDPRGPMTDNQALGQRRADAIREVLVANGCAPGVVRAYSQGEAGSSGSPETYAAERRVSVRTRERASN